MDLSPREVVPTAPSRARKRPWLAFAVLGLVLVGLVLGMVWTPCVGPTLGAAATLASSGRNLGEAGLTMLVFGLGVAGLVDLVTIDQVL